MEKKEHQSSKLTKSLDMPSFLGAMKFLGRTGVITPLQLAVHKFGNNEEQASEILEMLALQFRLVDRKESLDIPRRCGSGKITIYYLNKNGKRWLQENDRDFHSFSSHLSRKKIFQKHYCFHDLMVNKALLWLEKRVEILQFIPEREARRIRFIKQIRKRRQTGDVISKENYEAGAMCDFRVKIKTPKEKEPRWIECEVSLSLDADQIRKKPDDMLWFVYDEIDADLVRTIKGENARHVVAIGGLNSISYPMDEWQKRRQLALELVSTSQTPQKSSEKNIIKTLELLDGIGDASAISSILQIERSGVSRSLKELEAKGWLMSQAVSVEPGKKKGVPGKLYSLPRIEHLDIDGRKCLWIVSKCITEIAREGYRFQEFLPDISALRFQNFSDIQSAPLIVVIDQPETPIERLREIISKIKCEYPHDDILAQVYEQNRFELLAATELREYIVDFLSRA